jgi:hypothetical protein
MRGRLLYPLREMDQWQVATFDQGIPGVGKSLSLEVIQALFPPNKVGIIANKHSNNFGKSL